MSWWRSGSWRSVKSHRCRNVTKTIFRGSSLSGENDGIMSDGNSGNLQQRSLETCKGDQEFLYHHMLPAYYAESYANPAYASYCFWRKRRRNCLVFCGQSWMWRLLMPLRENWQNWLTDRTLYRCTIVLKRKMYRKQNRRFTGISMITVKSLWRIRSGKWSTGG